jgi:uncharacterized protein DUF4340
MKLRGLIVAGVILAALTGALYWSNKHPEADKARNPAETDSEPGPTIFSLKEADIAKFDLKRKDAAEVSLQRDGSGKWQMTAPQPLPIDQSAVISLLGTFSTFNSQRVVEQKPTNLDQYGLSAPAFEIDMTEKSGKMHQFFLGDEAPTGNSLYAKTGNSPEIYLVASFQRTSIDKTPNDLRDKRLLTASPEKISQVELLKKKENIVFGRSKDEWQILKPIPARADDYGVDQLVRKLTQAQMDLSGPDADPSKTTAAFSAGSSVVVAKITEPDGTQQLEIRKNKDSYYAKSSVVAGVYKIAADLPESLDKDVDTFRNKKLFDFGFDDPDKIELQSGSKKYFLTKGGEAWWGADGKKLDPDTADTLLSAVRDLSATKFVTAGFTSPTIEIVVTSGKGKRVEKVSIAKAGEDYIAKREGDTALYWIDDEPIKALQKAADDLKPAAATPAK